MIPAIYCRTSTDKQAKEESIQTQIAKLKEIVKNPIEYLDDGYSEADMNRPRLAQMMEDASKGLFDTLYIYNLDRLSRDGVRQKIILGGLQKLGIRVFEQNKEIENTPEAQMMASVYAVISKAEKDKIRQRSTDGRRRSAKEGRYVSGGVAPYGYKRIRDWENKKSHLEIDEEKARIVNKIFDIFLRFKSCRMTAIELTKRGYPAPAGGDRWYERAVNFILRNTAYIGTNYFNKRVRIESKASKEQTNGITKENWIEKLLPSVISEKRTSWKYRDKADWIPNEVPAIVDKKKFDEVQKILEFNHHKTQGKRARGFYMLTGLLKCSCGANMCGESNFDKKVKKTYRTYRCSDRIRKFPLKDYCKLGQVSANRIENAVWNEVMDISTRPHRLITLMSAFFNTPAFGEKKAGEIVANLTKIKTKLEKEKDRYLKLFGKGLFAEEKLKELIKDINKKQVDIDKEIDSSKKAIGEVLTEEEKIAMIINMVNREKIFSNKLSPEMKARRIRGLIDKVIYDKTKDEVQLYGKISILKQYDKSMSSRYSNLFAKIMGKKVEDIKQLTTKEAIKLAKGIDKYFKEMKKEIAKRGKEFQDFKKQENERDSKVPVSIHLGNRDMLGQVSLA